MNVEVILINNNYDLLLLILANFSVSCRKYQGSNQGVSLKFGDTSQEAPNRTVAGK